MNDPSKRPSNGFDAWFYQSSLLGMAILPHPVWVFPVPQRWWGGDGAIFCPPPPRRGGDGFSICIPNPPRPAPSPPSTNKNYNCKFSKP